MKYLKLRLLKTMLMEAKRVRLSPLLINYYYYFGVGKEYSLQK